MKHPQPVLIAGSGVIELEDGTKLPIPKPYIGLAPQSIRSVTSGKAKYVLTVENLTTFHEIALGKAGEVSGVVIYTAGMPSPALLRVYERCIEGILSEHDCHRWHWGDLGGFRIVACLARKHHSKLHLWSMDPTEYPDVPSRKPLSTDEIREICRIASIHEWEAIAAHVVTDGRAIEQEVLPLKLPLSI